jgi:hypothetical protein
MLETPNIEMLDTAPICGVAGVWGCAGRWHIEFPHLRFFDKPMGVFSVRDRIGFKEDRMKKIKTLIFAFVAGGAVLGMTYFAGQLGFERPREVLQQTIGVAESVAQNSCPRGQVWCCKTNPLTKNQECSCVYQGLC